MEALRAGAQADTRGAFAKQSCQHDGRARCSVAALAGRAGGQARATGCSAEL